MQTEKKKVAFCETSRAKYGKYFSLNIHMLEVEIVFFSHFKTPDQFHMRCIVQKSDLRMIYICY